MGYGRRSSALDRELLPLERLAAKLAGPRLLLEIDVGALIGTGLLRRVEAAT